MPGVFGTTQAARTGRPPAKPRPAPLPIPPIIHAAAPPASSYTPQSHAATYAAAPHHYTAATPPVAPTRAAPSHAAPPSHTDASSGGYKTAKATEGQLSNVRDYRPTLGEVIARQTLYKLIQQQRKTNPFSSITGYTPSPLATKFGRAMIKGQFHQDYLNLKQQGLLPKGAKEPPVGFSSKLGELSFESNGKVYFSPAAIFNHVNARSPIHAWAEMTPIHELAHALQSSGTLRSRAVREGGAQAFADATVPRVLGPMPNWDSNYTDFVKQVRKKLGSKWVMAGQFKQPGGA